MATRKVTPVAPVAETESDRTTPINVGPDLSTGLISAWDGVYYVFGGRFNGFDITEDGGIVIKEFSVDAKFDVTQILRDLNASTHKPRLSPTLSWLMGNKPEFFATDQDMTTWLVQSFKGSVPEGVNKSPEYARKAMGDLKTAYNIKRKQGPKPRSIPFKNLINISAEALKGVATTDPKGLEHLQSIIAEILAEQEVSAETVAV
jgi:hypothetical protein